MKYTPFLLAMLIAIGAAHAAVQFDVSLLRFEPVPANPGDTIEVWIQVENTGDETANNVRLLIDDSYPFTVANEQEHTIVVGTLAARTEYVKSVRIAISREAPQGTFELPVRVSAGTNAFSSFELPIQVQGSTASLAVLSATTTPAEVVPGSKATVALHVKNVEDTLLRDLTVSLGLTDTVFAPVGSTNQQKISRLSGGEEATIRFVIIPEPNAPSSVYRIPVAFNFTTNDGTALSQQEVIGIIVRAQPELSVVVDETELYNNGKEGTLLLRLVNKGLSEVKFAEVTLQEGEGYSLVGNTRTLYVGNIDSDDFETIEYALKPTADEFTVQLRLTYKDALNNAYEETVQLPIQTQAPPNEGGSVWVYIILALLVIGGIMWWRGRNKRR